MFNGKSVRKSDNLSLTLVLTCEVVLEDKVGDVRGVLDGGVLVGGVVVPRHDAPHHRTLATEWLKVTPNS